MVNDDIYAHLKTVREISGIRQRFGEKCEICAPESVLKTVAQYDGLITDASLELRLLYEYMYKQGLSEKQVAERIGRTKRAIQYRHRKLLEYFYRKTSE